MLQQQADGQTIQAADKQIAYLGLGIMGAAMVVNMAKSGCRVAAWNRTPGRPGESEAKSAGATVESSVKTVVEKADIIFICLGDAPDVEEVLLGTNGVAQYAKANALIIDMGTTGPVVARKLAAELKKHNLRFIDAPVSGGDVGARNATLTIMVGAEPADFEEALPVLELLGKKITHCGPVGNGQAVKLCNQVLCGINMVSLCEAFTLAEHLGLDRQLIVDVCGAGAGGSWALSNLGPKIIESDYRPAFMIKHMLKDLRLVTESMSESQAKLVGTELSRQMFESAQKLGGDNGDEQGTQAMFRAYSRK